MTSSHELRCYEYVNHPYAAVRDPRGHDPGVMYRRGTKGAAARADAIGAGLRVEIGALEIGADVEVKISEVRERSEGLHNHTPVTRLTIEWSAVRAPALFPRMHA